MRSSCGWTVSSLSDRLTNTERMNRKGNLFLYVAIFVSVLVLGLWMFVDQRIERQEVKENAEIETETISNLMKLNEYYAVQGKDVWCKESSILNSEQQFYPLLDPETNVPVKADAFIILKDLSGKTATNVYFNCSKISNDSENFVLLSEKFAKDSTKAYAVLSYEGIFMYPIEIASVDVKTFTHLAGDVAVDINSLYYLTKDTNGKQKINALKIDAPLETKSLNERYFINGSHVYFFKSTVRDEYGYIVKGSEIVLMENADSRTFRLALGKVWDAEDAYKKYKDGEEYTFVQ